MDFLQIIQHLYHQYMYRLFYPSQISMVHFQVKSSATLFLWNFIRKVNFFTNVSNP